MMLGEEFGVHLPRGLTTFIASIGPVGAAMEAAFPFLAIAVGATLLLEHLAKLREAGEKMTSDQMKFGTAIQNAFNSLDDKILQAEIRSDELRKNHLGALSKQLQLIDHQSLAELAHQFEAVAKTADIAFAELKTSWFQFGAGSARAKSELDEFHAKFDLLLAQGKDADAYGLLGSNLAQAQKVLALQRQAADNKHAGNLPGFDQSGDDAKLTAATQALAALKVKVGYDDKEIQAQSRLVDAYLALEGVQARINSLNKDDKKIARTEEGQKGDKDATKHGDALIHYNAEVNRMIAEDDKESVEYRMRTLVAGEKARVEATVQGSAARLAAINEAIHEEESANMMGQASYRSLLQDRATLVREMDKEAQQQHAEALREEAANDEQMGSLAVAAQKERWNAENAAHRVSDQVRLAQALQTAAEEFNIKMQAIVQEEAALDKSDKDYENKLKASQDKEKQLVQQHENEIAAIREKAEEQTNAVVKAERQRFDAEISSSLTKSIMGHETWSHMIISFGNQAVSAMIQNTIAYVLDNKTKQASDARAAAASAYKTGEGIGGPLGIVLGPAFAAAAFAGVMAFNEGGTVPGVGNFDSVPAVLTPGEHVSDKKLTQGLQKMVTDGGQSGPHYTVHHSPTYNVSTIDGDGMRDVLDKHSEQFTRHLEGQLRKMNR
jgi:hypothetical protein